MKKDIGIFFAHIFVMVCVLVVMVKALPSSAAGIGDFNKKVVSVFSQQQVIDNLSKISDIKTDKSGNTDITVTEVQRSSSGISGKDGDLYSQIKNTPDDIAKLMSAAKKTIKTEKVKGKTSEESYFGGGTLVSYGKVEVQSKIPESFYKLNIKELLKQKAELSIADVSKPTVLIYHSHTTESYTLLDTGYYTKSLDLRSNSNAQNMVRVGDEICKYLEMQGIGVIHDTVIHDEDYNGAYDSSRKSIEKYLEKYPTIEITIDVHRDDITYENNTKVKPTAKIDGKKAARMMIIAGAEYGRVKNYPDWEYNLRFDLAVQNKIAQMYPGLMRPILFSERKYNMDETRNSFLLEVGTDANTLDEACYSGRLFGVALGQLIKEEYSNK